MTVHLASGATREIDPSVAAFRGFSRFYTRLIGVLDERLVESGFSLSEARVLFELGARRDCGAGEIASELGIDPGYLSRILRKLEDGGLLDRSIAPTDARQAILRLTRKGKSALADLDRRSSAQAAGILDKLAPAQRATLVRSMGEIEGILGDKPEQRTPFILRPHRSGDMGWVVQRHGVLYTQEYGWDATFEALAARIAADFIDNFNAKREHCWIAERFGEPLGCVFLVQHPEQATSAKLRLLLVDPSARGLGLGKALVAECLQFARVAGYKKVTLWTQSILHAAHKIYQVHGFRLVLEEPHHSFGVDLIGQIWELNL
jgi:DNA-binding MarR family transcriptional regulator/GNAT superfamily N-acetyltransferase